LRSARDDTKRSSYTCFMDSGEHQPTPLVGARPHLRVVPRPAEGDEADAVTEAKARNRKSIVPPARPADGGAATPLNEAYVFGARLLVDQPAACRVGYRLFFVHNRDLGWIDLEASSTVYAVLGWHDNCDLQLPKLPGIANRQLLASCSLLADGTPALRLLDLQTGQPFTIDGQPRQSISVSGPLLIGLGEYRCALGCVPLPEFHQQRGALGTGHELPAYDTSEAEIPPEQSLRMMRRTHVTVMPRSVRLADLPLPPAGPAGSARLTLRRQARAVSIELSEADLYAGIIIGRAETCLDRGLRQVLSGQISRLHMLLLAERGRVYAMDLCSTNGTWHNGQRVRRVLMADGGTRLVLSGNDSKVELTWHPRVAGDAPRQPTVREFGPGPRNKG
jgi:hypothetical protein